MASNSQPAFVIPAVEADAGQLFAEWRKPLLRYLVCSGLTTDEGLDLVQDAFLCLHRHLLAGGARDNLRAWLFRVAHNLALNRAKSSGHRRSTSLDSEAGQHASPDDGPERLFFKKDRYRRLHRALRELPAVERDCVLLRSEGLRYREIAAVLDIGTSTVADHLDRALRTLGEKCNV